MAMRPFLDTLRDIRQGSLLDELTTEQHELLNQVLVTMRPGKVVVELDYRIDGCEQRASICAEHQAQTEERVRREEREAWQRDASERRDMIECTDDMTLRTRDEGGRGE